MKKIISMSFLFLIFISCSENVDETNNNNVNSFKVILTDSSPEKNEIYSQDFSLDSDGKVLKEIVISDLYPQYNSTSIFEYDSQGRVIKETRNNEVVTTVQWNGDVATLYGSSGNTGNTLSYTLLNNKVIESQFMGNIHKYIYDENENVISEMQADTVFVEYLDYDTTVKNPMNLIKSIGILRMSSNPYFKNFFETKKEYPFQDGDFSMPMRYYKFVKTSDSENKIIKITNDDNYYISKFEYN